jgi:hypothetical protein
MSSSNIKLSVRYGPKSSGSSNRKSLVGGSSTCSSSSFGDISE